MSVDRPCLLCVSKQQLDSDELLDIIEIYFELHSMPATSFTIILARPSQQSEGTICSKSQQPVPEIPHEGPKP